VVVKRENAVHAQKHYATELEKEQKKRDALQKDADKVRDEFEVGKPFGCLNTQLIVYIFNQDWIAKAEKIGNKVEVLRPRETIQREHDALTRGLEQRDQT
jgi:hypothetical protein